MKKQVALVGLLFFVGCAFATFDQTLPAPTPIPCSVGSCGLKERTNCTGLNVYHAPADDGCGSNGGHALFTDFTQPRPAGFGETRWFFEVVNGATTGRLDFYGNNVGDFARLYGSLRGESNLNDKWDLDLELVKVARSNIPSKNELAQSCPLANIFDLQASWDFYALRTDVPSRLVGKGINDGCTINIAFDRSNMYRAQIGYGGSEKNVRFGLTSWISYASFSYDDVKWPANIPARPRFNFNLKDRMKDGDINVNAYCPCQCNPPITSICGNNIVEDQEECDGGDCCDTLCKFKPNTVQCRAKTDECDKAEMCTGSSATCPADAFLPPTTQCTETVGFCDVRIPNFCPGTGPRCNGPPSISIDQGVTPWESFNVISFNNYNAVSGDVEGRLAVKNNLRITEGFSIGYLTDTTPSGKDRFVPAALVVGHDAYWPEGGSIWPDGTGVPNQSNEEGAFIGGDYTSLPMYLQHRIVGTSTVPGDKDSEFAAGQAFYTQLQNRFAAGTDNVQVVVQWNGLFLKCNSANATLYYASVTGDQLSTITWYNLENCNIQANYVINVRGSSSVVTIQGGQFPTITERVVYNVLGSGRTLNLLTGIGGNILAPNNIYHQTNGVTKGLVIVGDVTAVIQSNLPICTKFDPVVISAKTRERIAGGNKRQVGSDMIPVYSFGAFNKGDVIQIGVETTVIQDGIIDANGNKFFRVDPPITGQYDTGTNIKTVVNNPSSASREPAITPIIITPTTPSSQAINPTSDDDESESSSSSLVASVFGSVMLVLLAMW